MSVESEKEVPVTGFGARVREQLKARSWKQSQLGEFAGIGDSQMSRIVNDKRPPSMTDLKGIAEAFGMSLTELVGGTTAEHVLKSSLGSVSAAELSACFAEKLRMQQEKEALQIEYSALHERHRLLLDEYEVIRGTARGLEQKLGAANDALASAAREKGRLAENGERMRAEIGRLQVAVRQFQKAAQGYEREIARLSAAGRTAARDGAVAGGVLGGLGALIVGSLLSGGDSDDEDDFE